MRTRERVLRSLENVYRGAFEAAEERDDADAMSRLDMDYQRDQLQMELLLDIRDLLVTDDDEGEKGTSILEKAEAIRRLTKLR